MGNTSASPKDTSSSRLPPTAADLDIVPLRKRFDELARPPQLSADSEELRQGRPEERFVLFGDCSELVGPRGAQVASRLYGVLDANGDGRLDFEEFVSASRLLKGSPDEDKLTLLFKMYEDGTKGGLLGREGLQAFILDTIAASPPQFVPRYHGSDDRDDLVAQMHSTPRQLVPDGRRGTAGITRDAAAPDFELELENVLGCMADVVLTEYDADSDGMLTEREWRAYLKGEEEAVSVFLKTISDSVAKLLLP